jgi:hypothetical protein
MMIAPIAIAVIALAALAWFVHGHYMRKASFVRVLRSHGFRDERDPAKDVVDFTVTVQWPESRGIQYLSCFIKDHCEASEVVANVRCFVASGSRPEQIEHTIIALRFAGVELPGFSICPRDMESRFRYWTEGGRELQVGVPEFDDMFFVLAKEQSADVPFVKTHFSSLLPQYPDIVVETGGDTLLLFQQGRVLTADSLERHLDLADKLLESIGNV